MRRAFAIVLLALAALPSCAYYNTYYLTRKYYLTATGGLPYQVERPTGVQAGNYQKAVDYAKKLLGNYPKSKWVDDAYLMWAKALLGKDDPLQTVNMLRDFSTRFPSSPLKNEATFYLGVGYRQGRKYREALTALDEYLDKSKQGELAPYAHFERARALMSLNRPAEAAEAASQVIDRFPKSPLVDQARSTRAEARLASGDAAGARNDFTALGLHARDDNERFSFLLREADCLEAGRDYANELSLLEGARSHELQPVKTETGAAPSGPAAERYGQLTLRIGTAHLLSGRHDQALTAYKTVIQDYPKTPLGAEAQYRIAYAYETVLDNFETARLEYAKVRDQSVSSAFFAQATVRQVNLDRLARYRSAGGDSLDRQVEAGFLLAEQYLFELDKPARALDAYQQIARDHPRTPLAAKAINAEAWVLRHKLDRATEADSLLWAVVHEYPATEAQLAARDYLEAEGHDVPSDLIRMPETHLAAADSTPQLTRPPEGTAPLGAAPANIPPGLPIARVDSLARGPARPTTTAPPAPDAPSAGFTPGSAPSGPPTASAPTAPPSTGRGTVTQPGVARSHSPLDDPPRPAGNPSVPSPAPPPAPPDTSRSRP